MTMQNAGGTGGSGTSGDQGKQAGGTGGASGNEDKSKDQGRAVNYEAWYKGQDETVRGMLDGWERGLKTALESERTSRKDLDKQLRDMAGKAEKGSEAEKQLTGMADKISAADRRASFYEEAHAAGVTNLKLAYLAAVEEDLFDKRGNVNFEQMKKDFPELFGGGQKPKPAGNAGTGTNGQLTGQSMNEFIRKAAGRG